MSYLKFLLSKRKFQHFLLTQISLLIGILTVPLDIQYVYDIVILVLFTNPIYSVVQHLYFSHNYYQFRYGIIKKILVFYILLNSFWRFADLKSYHIMHHMNWLTDKDPTASEVRQGSFRYFLGLTQPSELSYKVSESDSFVTEVNRNFYLYKFIITALFLMIFGWYWYVHLVIIQQWLAYLAAKAHDILFHHHDDAKDKPWLFWLYGNEAFHIEHHKNFQNTVWHYRVFNIQYWYHKILYR